MPEPLKCLYDENTNILTVNGTHYSAPFFEFFSSTIVGDCFRVIRTKNGAVGLKRLERNG